jgi:hypothetical protein
MAAAEAPSAATPGRLTERNNLFSRPDTKRRKKRSKAAGKARERKRKPSNLKSGGARRIIEFDMKHVICWGANNTPFAP